MQTTAATTWTLLLGPWALAAVTLVIVVIAASMTGPKALRRLVDLGLIGWALISAFPLIWMLFTSFVPGEKLTSGGLTLVAGPSDLTLANYRALLGHSSIGLWVFNSVLVAVVATLGHLIFDSMAGWAFARLDFPLKRPLFALVVATMMVPGQIVTVPLFLQMAQLGLVDSLWSVILPSLSGPFGIFLFRTHCQGLPIELEEAARIDGCSEWAIFWRIVMPLSLPVLGTLGTFVFVTHWNAFLWPLICLLSATNYTLPVGLATLQGQHNLDHGLLMAGACVSALPMVITFLLFSRMFVQEIHAGALKG